MSYLGPTHLTRAEIELMFPLYQQKEANLPVTTLPYGTVVEISHLIPHPNSDRLVLVPIKGDLFTVERKDKWKLGDLALYISPGYTAGLHPESADQPTMSFLPPNNGPGAHTVKQRIIMGVPSHGFLIKAPPGVKVGMTPHAALEVFWDTNRKAHVARLNAERAEREWEANRKKAAEAARDKERLKLFAKMPTGFRLVARRSNTLMGRHTQMVIQRNVAGPDWISQKWVDTSDVFPSASSTLLTILPDSVSDTLLATW